MLTWLTNKPAYFPPHYPVTEKMRHGHQNTMKLRVYSLKHADLHAEFYTYCCYNISKNAAILIFAEKRIVSIICAK